MNEQEQKPIGSIYTLGYAAPDASQQLEQLMAHPSMLLVDVRLWPRSRWWPQWSKKALRARWGTRYSHEKRLSNLNYRDQTQPVMLCGPHAERAIVGAAVLVLHGWSLVLLCACRDADLCHRTFVAALIQRELAAFLAAPASSGEVVFLPDGTCVDRGDA